MKKPEEYLKLIHAKDFNPSSLGEAIKLVIKQAQIDAIKETCKKCASEADVKHVFVSTGDYSGHDSWMVDANSILSVADKLIKELE